MSSDCLNFGRDEIMYLITAENFLGNLCLSEFAFLEISAGRVNSYYYS